MQTVCAPGEVVNGFDISSYQPVVDFKLYKANGNEFCFIKASENLYKDPCFDAHWANSKAAGILRGAYHYYHPKDDALAQANYFSNVVGKLGAGDLPCVMDWETTDGFPSSVDRAGGALFLQTVAEKTGKTPIVYGSPYFLQDLLLDESFANYALWIAHYQTKCPLVPTPWKYWSFWQYTDGGASNMDLNKFNGPLSQLQKFAE
jgi:lysozyme